MTNVEYDRKFHRLTVKGHADAGKYGEDIVCAAASILTLTFAAAVNNAAECGRVKEPVIDIVPGRSEISCRPVCGYEAVITLMLDTVCGGFEILQRQAPENLTYRLII